jgi:hypothetical protein
MQIIKCSHFPAILEPCECDKHAFSHQIAYMNCLLTTKSMSKRDKHIPMYE